MSPLNIAVSSVESSLAKYIYRERTTFILFCYNNPQPANHPILKIFRKRGYIECNQKNDQFLVMDVTLNR